MHSTPPLGDTVSSDCPLGYVQHLRCSKKNTTTVWWYWRSKGLCRWHFDLGKPVEEQSVVRRSLGKKTGVSLKAKPTVNLWDANNIPGRHIARLSADHNKFEGFWSVKEPVPDVTAWRTMSARTKPGESCMVIHPDLLSPYECFTVLPTDKSFRDSVKIWFHHRMLNLYVRFLR